MVDAASPPSAERLPVALDPDHPDYKPHEELAAALRACKPLLWTAAAFSGAVNLLFLASPIYLIQIYNRVIPSGSIPTLIGLSVALLLALATMAVLDAARARILVRAAARIDRLLSGRVFQAVIDNATRNGGGAKNAQLLRDLDQFRSALAGQAAQFFFDVPFMPLFLIALFLIHPVLGLAGTLGAAMLIGLAFLNDRTTRTSAKASNDAAIRSYQFTDAIARHADPVHAMGMDGALLKRWRRDRDTMMERQASGSDRTADVTATIRFVRLTMQAAMLGLGAWLVIEGSILAASIFAANMMLGRALAPLEVAVGGWRQIEQGMASGKRVQLGLNSAPHRRPRVEPPVTAASVVLQEVSFQFKGAKRPALRGIDLEIAAGEAVGVVGPSGAGKSCLARLLVGARLAEQGRVSVGGVDVRHWSRSMLARHIGYLPQTVGLFPGTLRDNIARFGDGSDAEVIAAARRANVHDMIMALPDAYETRVDEGGTGLSGGQRQRVGLARALYGEPKLLVLDEPNAHLDADGEEALARSLHTLKAAGCTVILIAHRLNPVAHVDRVIVLSDGQLQLDGPRARVFRKVRTELVESIAREPMKV
jgi:ATP-binding cassette, subfamily C, bacterial exporter for protease/lipase